MIVDTARRAADLFLPVFAAARVEWVATAHLDPDRRLIELITEGPGGPDQAELPVRTILIAALRLGSAGLIVAHNHPSGDPSPSEADRAATRLLADAARGLEIRLHDHLIFAGDECRSFRLLKLL